MSPIENCLDCTFTDLRTVAEQIGPIGRPPCMVWIVRCEQDTMTRCCQISDFADYFTLVAEIQTRGRLVEYDELRLLSERSCQQDQLPFAARDHGVGPFAQMGDAHSFKRLLGYGAVGGVRPAEKIAVRGSAHKHDRFDREGKGGDMRLRHIGEQVCALLARKVSQRPLSQLNFT